MQAQQERDGRGFTLIEMLVVMTLIGILTGIISVVLVQARRQSLQAACGENLRNIGTTITGITLENNGNYPVLYADADGDSVAHTAWDGSNGVPWWVKVHNEWSGKKKLDSDTTTEEEVNLEAALPGSMQVFHCPMAPDLPTPDTSLSDAERIQAVDAGICYGLNFDVKLSDGTPYECLDETDSDYPDLQNPPSDAADREPDPYRIAEIKLDAEFVLVSEADVENGTGGRIRCEETEDPGNDEAPVIARHEGTANVLYGDGHVDAVEAGTGAINADINLRTQEWTLPRD